MEVTQYEATMTVIIQPPKTDTEILRNPGGVYITELSFGTVLSKNQEAQGASKQRSLDEKNCISEFILLHVCRSGLGRC